MRHLACLALLFVAISAAAKIDPHVFTMYKSESDIASYIVGLEDANLDTSDVVPTDRPKYVYEALTQWSQKTQAPLRAHLDSLGVKYKSYWIANIIVVQSNLSVALELAERDDVVTLEANKEFKSILGTPDVVQANITAPGAIEWNIARVFAPEVWEQGIRGTGLVVANADTGVAWQHPALINQYRGNQGDSPDHNYNWWDSIHSGTNPNCGIDSQEPCDDNGHGTHTTGTAVGEVGTNQIGVAPGATWIACRNMNRGLGTPQTYIECLQFFVAPHKLDGTDADPTRAPHVIGNSYGCPPSEGCAPNALQTTVRNVINAGIFMSVSAGNDGSSCSSVRDPPAHYADSFSVGATTSGANNDIASYSSRGPVTVDQSGRLKPNIVAPGSGVRSSVPPSGYASYSGTSMASPHVTGAIPLIWQALPGLLRNPVQTVAVLQDASSPRDFNGCGSSGVPNNVYGYGMLNILSAVSPGRRDE